MKSSHLFGTLFIVLLIASCKCTRKFLLFSCTIIFICCSSPRNTGLKNDRELRQGHITLKDKLTK